MWHLQTKQSEVTSNLTKGARDACQTRTLAKDPVYTRYKHNEWLAWIKSEIGIELTYGSQTAIRRGQNPSLRICHFQGIGISFQGVGTPFQGIGISRGPNRQLNSVILSPSPQPHGQEKSTHCVLWEYGASHPARGTPALPHVPGSPRDFYERPKGVSRTRCGMAKRKRSRAFISQ